jgi:hypothetical protein
MSDWGQGAKNNNIGWGQGAVNNNISWGSVHENSWAGDTDIVGVTEEVQYFVRPSGTTYGDSSGTSFANAWSGFPSINWTLLENKTLNICGTHLQLLTIQQDNVTIVGNNVLGAGIIDGQSARICLTIDGYDNVTINELTLNNGLVSNALNKLTSGTIYNDCIFDTSTNQTTQHEGDYLSALIEVTYNNCTFKNGVDDGVSLHGNNTTVTLNNCSMENNSQGVNAINTGVCVMNDCNFTGNATDIQPDSDSDFTANRCTFRSTLTSNSTIDLKINNSLFLSGNLQSSSIGGVLVKDSKFLNNSKITSNQTNILRVNVLRCYFEVNANAKIDRITNGVFKLEYCTFKHTGSTNIYAVNTGGIGTSIINNCNFIGNANVGRGIAALGAVNVKNTIFTLLNQCVNPNGVLAIVTFDYCNTYLNTNININQNGGTFVNTNNITTNPLFTDIANLDFRLQVGSGSIGTGTTLTNATGILTADWVSTFPTVVTKNQLASWNRGAYVN